MGGSVAVCQSTRQVKGGEGGAEEIVLLAIVSPLWYKRHIFSAKTTTGTRLANKICVALGKRTRRKGGKGGRILFFLEHRAEKSRKNKAKFVLAKGRCESRSRGLFSWVASVSALPAIYRAATNPPTALVGNLAGFP